MSGIKITPQPITPVFPEKQIGKLSESSKEDFGDFLMKAIQDIDGLQKQSGEAQDKLIQGEAAELHQVMIAAEKAGISFDLLLEIRKKLLDAYQEIIRMPV
jgi:flagellar hook-basal body complex protein FliE